jgi:phytoene synthase
LSSELARIPFAVSREPAMGAIRLQWWRDALEMPSQLSTGSEIADAVRTVARTFSLDGQLLSGMVDGRNASLDPEPFSGDAELRAFLWETEGAQFAMASQILGGGQAEPDLHPAHVAAGQAYGLARMLLDLPRNLSLGRVPLASADLDAADLSAQDLRAGAQPQAIRRLLRLCRADMVELLEYRLHPVNVTLIAVVLALSRLVGSAKTDQVGGDHAMPGGDEQGDHLAIQVTPRWFTMHQQHRSGCGWPLVEVVHA